MCKGVVRGNYVAPDNVRILSDGPKTCWWLHDIVGDVAGDAAKLPGIFLGICRGSVRGFAEDLLSPSQRVCGKEHVHMCSVFRASLLLPTNFLGKKMISRSFPRLYWKILKGVFVGCVQKVAGAMCFGHDFPCRERLSDGHTHSNRHCDPCGDHPMTKVSQSPFRMSSHQ